MPSKLLTHGTLLTFNSSTSSIEVLLDSHLLIADDTITQITSDLSTITLPPSTETIDCTNKIISPGFVDTHRHLWQTAYRSLGANTFLSEYLFKYSAIGNAKEALSPSDIYISTLAGYCDAIHTGVTTILDHAHMAWREEVMQPALLAALDSNTRTFWCFDATAAHTAKGWSYDSQISTLTTLIKTRLPSPHPLLTLGIAIDVLDSATPAQIDEIKSFLTTLPLHVMTTHYLGGPWPAAANSPTLADTHGLLDLPQPLIFSHAGFLPSSEITLLREKNHFLSITPESEMHYGHGQVSSRECNDHASLGVDTAWTFSGDMLTQARLWLQSNRNDRYEKVLQEGKIPSSNPMSAETAFLLATRQGGLALRRDDLGVIKTGAKADLVIFDATSPNLIGSSDALSAVVMHANVGDIEGVIVGGEWRKRDGKLVGTFGEKGTWEDVRREFAEVAARVQEQLARDGSPSMPEDLFGVPMKETERVVL